MNLGSHFEEAKKKKNLCVIWPLKGAAIIKIPLWLITLAFFAFKNNSYVWSYSGRSEGQELASCYVNLINAAAILDFTERMKHFAQFTKFVQSSPNLAQMTFGASQKLFLSISICKSVCHSQLKWVVEPPNRKWDHILETLSCIDTKLDKGTREPIFRKNNNFFVIWPQVGEGGWW